MTRYSEVFTKLDRAALIPFFVIGDPDYTASLEIVKSALDSGADILELGIAFSDPIADGPTIQKADIRALSAGINVKKSLEFIAEITEYKPVPIGLLVYYNLVYHYGVEKFFNDFAAAGGSSVLIADLSIDDAEQISPAARQAGLDTVFMVTPNTSDDRMKQIVSQTTGFVYTVSTLGVTGARDSLSDMISPLIKKLKSVTSVPICVGFGISSADHAAEVAKAGADGVIIGSRIVKIIEENLDNIPEAGRQVSRFITTVKKALE